MPKTFAAKLPAILILILLIGLPIMLSAQDDPSVEIDWDHYFPYDIYARGDQTIFINLGVIFPTLFFINNEVNNDGWRFMGGTGSLIFNRYLFPRLFIGGELSVMFLPIRDRNTAFIFPVGLRIGTQFFAGQFEFPIAASAGVSWRSYLGERNFNMYLKGSVSALYRATTQWAFGATTSWYFFPEWTSVATVYGNFLDITLTARYHF